MEAKAFSSSHRTKVFADGIGTEEQRVTSGELAASLGGTKASEPISEMASDALSVVGRLSSTASAAKTARPRNRRPSGSGKAAGEDGWNETEGWKSKDAEGGTVP